LIYSCKNNNQEQSNSKNNYNDYNDTEIEARKREALEYLKEGLKKFPGVKTWLEVIKKLEDESGKD
jgi:hypothetical protein